MNPTSAPSVTLDQVNAAIIDETYTVLPDGRTTVCQLTLDNGFTVEGFSACVSIENFNLELGKKYSRERAQNRVWEFLGFRLADQLAAQRAPLGIRLQNEHTEIKARHSKLGAFILDNPHFSQLSIRQQALLQEQEAIMGEYVQVLDDRMQDLGLL